MSHCSHGSGQVYKTNPHSPQKKKITHKLWGEGRRCPKSWRRLWFISLSVIFRLKCRCWPRVNVRQLWTDAPQLKVRTDTHKTVGVFADIGNGHVLCTLTEAEILSFYQVTTAQDKMHYRRACNCRGNVMWQMAFVPLPFQCSVNSVVHITAVYWFWVAVQIFTEGAPSV